MAKNTYAVGKRYTYRGTLEGAREKGVAFENIPEEFMVYECILLDGPNGPVFHEVGSTKYFDLEAITEEALVELKEPLSTWVVVQDRADGTVSFASMGYASRKDAERILDDFYTQAKGYRVVQLREVHG